MDHSSSATPLKSSAIPRFSSKLPTSRLPAPGNDSKSALPSPSKVPTGRASPVKRALPRPSSGASSRTSISGNPSGILPPKAPSHRPTYSYSDRSISSVTTTRKPAARPASFIGKPRGPPPSSATNTQAEDLNDQLGSLDGFRSASRAASRQGNRDDDPSYDSNHEDAYDGPSTPQSKGSRVSLADRTVESISRLPATPGTDRRRSSFFAPQSPMGPPSRPASAMSIGSRPGTSEGSFAKPKGRPFSPVKMTPVGSKTSQRISVDYSAPKTAPSTRNSTAALPRPGRMSSIAAKSSVPSGTPKPAAAKPLQRTTSLRQPGLSSSTVSKTPKLRSTTGNSNVKAKATPATAVRNKPAVEPASPLEHSPSKPSSSSAALREQIAKAKAAKRTVATAPSKNVTTEANGSEFDPFADPFNTKPKDNKGLLRKRIDAARADGRLNIAAMGLKSIPDEVLCMYDADQMADSNVTWSQTMDLVRLAAADNEIDTISDNVFPDIDSETAVNDEVDAKAMQFRGLELIDLHGNSLQTVPVGLRWLERLTVLNLSHNKLTNSVFDTITQIEGLKDLRLGSNNLSGYLPQSISRLRNLKTLELQSNKLLSLPEHLRELGNLQVLNVAGNQLSGLPMDVLETLPIVDLNVSNNAMVGALFPFGVPGLPRLEYLDVANNSLASLAFSENLSLPALKALNIASNRIVGLPDVSGWVELVSLAAADNKVSMLPQGFTTLKHLRQADFSGNELTKLHDNIGLMDSLDVLKVDANPLRERKFLNLSTDELKRNLLERLKASGQGDKADDFEDEGIDIQSPQDSNAQWNIVAGVLDLRDKDLVDDDADVLRSVLGSNDVRDLKLARNSFSTIPFEISLAQNLKILDLSHCALGEGYLTEVLTLQALQELFLGSNKISSWDPLLSLLHAPRLSYLDVSNNRLIGSLPTMKDAFPELKVLHAGNNRLDAVSAEALKGLSSVDLSDNNIGYIPPHIGLLWSEGLKGLSLGGNVFRVPSHRVLEKGTEAILTWLREKIPECESEA